MNGMTVARAVRIEVEPTLRLVRPPELRNPERKRLERHRGVERAKVKKALWNVVSILTLGKSINQIGDLTERVAARYAFKYTGGRKHQGKVEKGLDFERVREIYYVYLNAIRDGWKATLKDIGDKTRTHFVSVGRVLSRVGLEPLCEPHITIEKNKEIVLAGRLEYLSAGDISHFTGIKKHTVRNTLRKLGRRRKGEMIEVGDNSGRVLGRLSYRMASQIYLAEDIGMAELPMDEFAKTLGAHPDVILYALIHRTEIEPKIVRALRVIKNNPEIDKPYLT